jgi:FtsP/CotA-like multicopper oxidase with cupredoxin domain
MNLPGRITLLIAILFPAISFAQLCDPGDIRNPEQFAWEYVSDPADPHWVGTMEIVEADLTVGGESIHTRVYKQDTGGIGIPGPTMNMTPGEKYVLQFRNRLPYEAKSEEHNVFKDPNVSNLHTHGLHISGMSPGDDVTRSFEGGAGGDFVYDIPEDHMGGTFWYHAHHHGSTYLQVSAGAFGMIVIDDSGDGIPASVAAMEERQLVVAYLDPNVAGTGGDTLITGTLSPTWTVNGKVNGKMCVPSDTWQHWRVLLADRDAKEKTVSVGSNCELALMARDGVWRTEVPKPLSTNSISLTGASRADLAVRCSGDADLSVGSQTVASILVDGSLPGNPPAHPYDETYEQTWFSARPDYLRDLRGLLPSNSESVNMGARTINGSKFDHHVPTFTLNTEGVQQFTLKGATNHPFHLHIYHVQVQQNCGDFEAGEYYDVVSGNCSIRFDLSPDSKPYDGRTIMHCHILEHEDQGAMGWADVDLAFGQPAPTFPAGYGYDDDIPPDITPCDPPAAPSGLTATAASSSQIDLAWSDNSSDETLFDIERSTDGGVSFNYLASTGTDSTGYSNTGLTPNTRYDYQVLASKPGCSSAPSTAAFDTTDPADVGTALAVGSITVDTEGAGKGQKRERAVVVVEDDAGNLIENATVTGMFSGTITETVIGPSTGPDGSTTLVTDGTAKGAVSFQFCVTLITADGLTQFEAANGLICASF